MKYQYLLQKVRNQYEELLKERSKKLEEVDKTFYPKFQEAIVPIDFHFERYQHEKDRLKNKILDLHKKKYELRWQNYQVFQDKVETTKEPSSHATTIDNESQSHLEVNTKENKEIIYFYKNEPNLKSAFSSPRKHHE